jgi:sortase (surface protein transpeptidase)
MDDVTEASSPLGDGDASNTNDEAGQRSASSSRVRRMMAAACLIGALVLALVAWSARGGDDEVVLLAPTATIDPALLPTAVRPTTTLRPAATAPPSTSIPLSPLADQLGERLSAFPQPPSDLPVPMGIRIESISVDTGAVIPIGIDDGGELDIPGAKEVGWYQLGQRPGQPGATVLAAHVSWMGQAGVFARLGRLEPGAEVFVRLSDGTERRYIAMERTMYDKQQLPYDRIWTREGQEVLVLITCGGRFNPEIRRFRENIVVYAVPVPVPEAEPTPG